MQVSFPQVENHICHLEPVEFLIVVDGKTVRAAIDWSIMKQLLNAGSISEETVRDFIHHHRNTFELAMKAHLFAHGVPLTRQFTMTLDDFAFDWPTALTPAPLSL